MKRKHKRYSKPKTPFEKIRIEEEKKIVEEFGLKNKREIWRAEAKIKSIRERAKRLISAKAEDHKAFFERLNKMGFEVKTIANVLSLDKKDYLKRRLQTIVVKKRLATTPKAARQLIVHKKVMVDGEVVDSPSYLVSIGLEEKIEIKKKQKTTKKIVEEKHD
ncbi:MAG TPA: 30S ribosomal protein S4 [Candidatus Nanoarchaeia archaeon]|nr:30S ribosomal protein S4 [Candidatus Nanoarchaeia archaeon]